MCFGSLKRELVTKRQPDISRSGMECVSGALMREPETGLPTTGTSLRSPNSLKCTFAYTDCKEYIKKIISVNGSDTALVSR